MTALGLVGRDGELRILTDLVDQIGARGDAIVVVGEAGIGKSSLLRAAAEHGRQAGLTVLATTGIEAEAQLPFAGLHQLMRPLLGSTDQLSATQRQALLAAFGATDTIQPESFMIALAALSLIAEAATRQPLLLIADDVHWLDGPTQDVLAFIARRVSADPIVLIGSLRTDIDALFGHAGLPELTVRGLDDAAAREVMLTHAGDLSYASRERILATAQGNPLALVELPIALRGTPDASLETLPLTARLERAFAARIADLPPLARDAVLVAAVDYSDDLPEILAATAVLAGQEVSVSVLELATAAGLLRFDDLHVRFSHPLVRSGVLQFEPVTRRYAANAALAEVLTGEPYRRAWHRAQSIVGPDDDVAAELEASHTIALRRGSATSAIWALERSAQLTTDSAQRGRRLLLAAGHAFSLGRADLVDELLAKAARTDLSDLQQAKMQWLREIFNDGVPGDAGQVFNLCEVAQRAIAASDSDLALNLLLGAALRCWWADTGPAARARVVDVTHQIRDAARDPRYLAALGVAEPVLQGAPVVNLLDKVTIEQVSDADELRLLGMAAHSVGHSARAADFLDRSETRLREQGRLGLLPHVLGMQVQVRLALGDWERATAAADEGRRLGAETGQPIWTAGALVSEAMASGLRGDADRAVDLATQIEKMASSRRLNDYLACARLARGYAWLSSGRHTDAYHELLPLFDPADPSYHQRERFNGVMFLAEAAVHAGFIPQARAVLAGLDEVAAVTPAPILRVHMLYAHAILADDTEAESRYLAAQREDLTRWPWPQARIKLAYGSWLRRQRRAAESRVPLRSALTTLDLIGARSWADQARAELRAAGERTAAQQPSAEGMLSVQELQIARLAAEGLSNREIGERLYLSPRTVGSHLYRIFPKLDITSRAQLASRLEPA